METTTGTVTVWQSGRLAPRGAAPDLQWRREHSLLAALLGLSAVVLTAFVVVLERDVDSGELQHAVQHARAVAEARCEADQPARRRGRCIAMLDGDVAAREVSTPAAPGDPAADADPAQENAARATTLSLLDPR